MAVKYFKTHNGRYALRKNIKIIKGVHYHKDDLILIKKKYHRVDNKKVLFNLDNDKYEIVNDKKHTVDYIFVVRDRMYYTTQLVRYAVETIEGSFIVWNREYAKFLGALYTSGYRSFSYKRVNYKPKMPFELAYNYDPIISYQSDIIKRKVPSDNGFNKSFSEQMDKFFNTFTIGLEIETSGGMLSEPEVIDSQLIPLKDGSISGIEYVSTPINKIEDLYRVYNALNESKLSISDKCSFHLHVSGLPITKEAGLSFYYLCCRIQQEFHSCIPSYKRSIDFLKNKQKDHSRLFTNFGLNYFEKVNVKDHFHYLFDFLTGTKGLDLGDSHPLEGSQKWNFHMRYYYVNMLNLYFSKSKTVEFRLFPPTTDPDLMMIWILISLCIVKVSKDYSEQVFDNSRKLTLIQVIKLADMSKDLENLVIEYIKTASSNNYTRYISQSNYYKNYISDYKKIVDSLDTKCISNRKKPPLVMKRGITYSIPNIEI